MTARTIASTCSRVLHSMATSAMSQLRPSWNWKHEKACGARMGKIDMLKRTRATWKSSRTHLECHVGDHGVEKKCDAQQDGRHDVLKSVGPREEDAAAKLQIGDDDEGSECHEDDRRKQPEEEALCVAVGADACKRHTLDAERDGDAQLRKQRPDLRGQEDLVHVLHLDADLVCGCT